MRHFAEVLDEQGNVLSHVTRNVEDAADLESMLGAALRDVRRKFPHRNLYSTPTEISVACTIRWGKHEAARTAESND